MDNQFIPIREAEVIDNEHGFPLEKIWTFIDRGKNFKPLKLE